MKVKKGKVYLVGAGPGDPGLITLKGIECIKNSNVIIYDRLINNRLLDYAENSEKIYVGKGPGRHSMSQESINQLIIEKAQEGKRVTRLKGGDPFVFGRGGEEARALAKRDIPFEIVPGITSAVSVPAYAGIPITHRGISTSFHVFSGHEKEKDTLSLDWEQISKLDGTLIFLMGMKNLETIVEKLIEYGHPANMPVAIIEWGTIEKQRTLISTLENVESQVIQQKFGSPSVIVVGEVVNLRKEMKWIEKKELWGKKIVITRAKNQSENFKQKLESFGAEVISFPTICIVPMKNNEKLDKVIDKVNIYSWIVFTSVNSVDIFFDHMRGLGRDIRSLGNVKICAIGSSTQKKLQEKGLNTDFVPSNHCQEGIIQGLKAKLNQEDNVLILQAELGRDTIKNSLENIGIEVDMVPMYKTMPSDEDSDFIVNLLTQRQVDWITFTSPSTVENFVNVIRKYNNFNLQDIKIACIGPVTAKAACELGLIVTAVAKEYTIDGLIKAMAECEIKSGR